MTHEACSDRCSEWQLTLWERASGGCTHCFRVHAAVTSRSAGRSGGHRVEGLPRTRGSSSHSRAHSASAIRRSDAGERHRPSVPGRSSNLCSARVISQHFIGPPDVSRVAPESPDNESHAAMSRSPLVPPRPRPSMQTSEYWFIVSPGAPEIFEALRRVVAQNPGFHVIIDRRIASTSPPTTERRRAMVWQGDTILIAESAKDS
jgi:hypothetical protein